MGRGGRKEPLYRKVNTRTWGVRHGCGKVVRPDSGSRQSMRQGLRHGLDHTPLYRFLVSKVGQEWPGVHSEAVSRLNSEDPIWHLVARSRAEGSPRVRIGQSAYFSGLFIDENQILQKVDPEMTADDMRPFCACCTHTFNGVRFGLPFDASQTPEVE